jgi:hypothetical protein
MATQVYSTVFDEFINPIIDSLTVDVARRIADSGVRSEFQSRIDELADKANEGALTPAEHQEYAQIVELIDIFSLLRLRARILAERDMG